MSIPYEPRRIEPDVADDRHERLPNHIGRRILCYGHVLPWPPRAGNELRIHSLMRWLAHQGLQVLVVICPTSNHSVSQQQLQEMAAIYPNLIVCTHDGVLWHNQTVVDIERIRGRQIAETTKLLEPIDADPAQAGTLALQKSFCPDVLVDLLRYLDNAWRPDFVLAEYGFMTRAFPLLRRDAVKIVDTIDVFSSKASKVERHGVSDGFALTEAGEAALLRRADVMIGIQRDETAALRRLLPEREIVTIGVDFKVLDKIDHPRARRPVVLLVASDNPMNVKGLEDFLSAAWPMIYAKVVDVELRIIGAICDRIDALPEGVRSLGRLAELDTEYDAAAVVINPVIAGTGLKIKTIEALCHLKPIVSWPAGVDGLAPSIVPYCHVVETWPQFAQNVIAILQNTDRPKLHGLRDLLAEEFSAEQVYKPLRRVLDRQKAPPKTGWRAWLHAWYARPTSSRDLAP